LKNNTHFVVIITLKYTLPLIPDHSKVVNFFPMGGKHHLVFERVITTIHFHKKVNDKVLTKQILKGFKDFRVEWRWVLLFLY